jgi:hypothetical protein
LEEPVELAVVVESLPFLTTLALAAAEAAESFEARSFLEAERVGACFFDIVWAKETGLFALLAFFSGEPGLKFKARGPASLVDVGMMVERVAGRVKLAVGWSILLKVSRFVGESDVLILVYSWMILCSGCCIAK